MQNWHDLDQVKAFANKLARMSRMQQTVFKAPERDTYNIIHTANEVKHLPVGAEVVYRTGCYQKEKQMKST